MPIINTDPKITTYYNGGADFLIDPKGWTEFHKKTCNGCEKCQ